jgi:hypothetical protein
VRKTPGPDALEQGLRIGCGALLGLAFLGVVAAQIWTDGGVSGIAWLGIALGTAVFAFLAWRHGDEFWHSFAEAVRRWW